MINWFEVTLYFLSGMLVGFAARMVIDEWTKLKEKNA